MIEPTEPTEIITETTQIKEVIIETTTEEPTTSAPVYHETTTQPSNGYSTYTITAYCSCEKCCGIWAASNKKVDENGETIVVGAAGRKLTPGYSIASSLPFGTKIYIEGYGTVEVMDRGTSGNHLDLYFSDHDTALSWGRQTRTGYIEEWP